MFDPFYKLALGLFTGILFGFLLQKGRVTKQHVIVGVFLLKDFTALKIIATAATVGSIGVYALVQLGLASLHPTPAMFGGVFLGGIFFAIGIVLLGYCPGTSVASAGEGHRDAMIGVLGMFFGAGSFVAAYGYLEPWIKGFGNWGKITLPELTLSSPWIWIFGLSVLVLTVSTLIERMKRRFNASS